MKTVRAVVSAAAGLLGFLMLWPYYGVDTDPPECWSTFDWHVPCEGSWLAVAVGVTLGLSIWVLLGLLDRYFRKSKA